MQERRRRSAGVRFKVTTEQRPKEGEGAGHANPWEKVAPDRATSIDRLPTAQLRARSKRWTFKALTKIHVHSKDDRLPFNSGPPPTWIPHVAPWRTGSLRNKLESSWRWRRIPDSGTCRGGNWEFTYQDRIVYLRLENASDVSSRADQEARLIQERADWM